MNTQNNLFDLSNPVAIVTGGNGGIAAYLMSPASGYQTGTSTVLDGGYCIF